MVSSRQTERERTKGSNNIRQKVYLIFNRDRFLWIIFCVFAGREGMISIAVELRMSSINDQVSVNLSSKLELKIMN